MNVVSLKADQLGYVKNGSNAIIRSSKFGQIERCFPLRLKVEIFKSRYPANSA